MMDLPDKTAGEPQPKKKVITPVASGAKKVDRPATRRFLDFLFAESPKALAGKVARDVLWPRAKAGFEEAANSFLAGMLWGDGVNRPLPNIVKGTVLRGGGMNYQAISTQNSMTQARQANVSRSSGNYQDLVLPTQPMAEAVLGNMYELLNEYRMVAVADLYEAAGVTPAPSDNAYGWMSMDGARISKVRDGYLLELPRPSLL
jgi:hypothetical protein